MARACVVTVIVAWLATAGAVGAQVHSRPTPPPDRTAAGEPWYTSRAPIFVNGAYYERAGASVFFDGDAMVPVGRIAGVPVYADSTLEPWSMVFVPIDGGLVQPYERRRDGELAGTTGSRAPSFPVAPATDTDDRPATTFADDSASSPATVSAQRPTSVTRTGAPATSSHPVARGVWTALPPVGSRGIWIPFEGRVWKSAGWAEALDTATLVPSGSYAGFPVYRANDRDDVLYVPVVQGGLLTPYRRTSDAAEP